MSNYTDFVNNYMKNKLNEASASDIIKKLNELCADENTTSDTIRGYLVDSFKNDYDEFKKIFGTKEVKISHDKDDVQKVTWSFGKSDFHPNAYKKGQEESAFTEAYMTFIGIDINLKNAKSMFIKKKYVKILEADEKPSEIQDIISKNAEDFCKTIGLTYDATTDAAEITKQLKASAYMKSIEKSIQQVANRAKAAEKLSFSTKKSDWNRFAKVITYKCVEMLSEFSSKDTKIKASDMQNYMAKVFSEESDDYFSKIESMDELMDIDATLGVFEDLNKRGMEEPEKQNQSYELVIDKPFINEGDSKTDIKDENLTLDAYRNAMKTMHDKGKGSVLAYVNKVKEKYADKFKQFKNELNAEFDKGRQEIIESEKADTMQNFTDPLSGTTEKRVGRLGHHGPMTYINNSPNLKSAVEAIDGQKWNIFNCAAKLLIKFMKVLEEGSKSLQRMTSEIAAGYKQCKEAFDAEKITDYRDELEEIVASDDSKEDKQEKLLALLAASIAKYENQLYTDLNNMTKTPWFAKSEGEEENLYQLSPKLTKALQDKIGLILKDLEENYTYTAESLEKLDNGEDVEVKEKPQETEETPAEGEQPAEETKEAPQQNASYKPTLKNFINEVDDDMMKSTEDMVNKEGEKVQKDAKAEQDKEVAANKDAKGEEIKQGDKKEKEKETKQVEPWQNRKFCFSGSNFEVDAGEFGSIIEKGEVTELAKFYRDIADKVDGDAKTSFIGIADFIELPNPEKKLEEGRFLYNKEIQIATINGQQFMDACKALMEKLKEVYPNIKSMVGHEKITLEPEQVSEITELVSNDYSSQEINQLGSIGTPLLAFISNEDKTSTGDMVPAAGEIQQQVSGINTDITKANKDNYRNAIKDIIDRFNKLKGKYGDFVQKAGHPDGPARVALKKGIKDGDNFKTIDYLTSVDLTETKGILPTIFVICSYFKHVKEWNDKYKLYKSLPEASAYDSEIDEALKRIDVAIPQDIKADVYDKSKGDWEAAEYKAVIDQITKLIGFVQKNPKIINNEFLESIKEIEAFKSFSESAEAFVNGLQSDTVDPVYKLMALIGLNINDEDEANGKLPDDLIKEIQQYTSTIEKIGNGSVEEVSKYKQQGQDLGKKIMDAVNDNKELHDYIAEFLKRLGEATKETEGLYVISMVYAYNVFAVAEDLKPLLENFTKITNIFVMEGYENSFAYLNENSLEKFIKSWKQAADSQNPKKRMAAAGRVAEELKKLGKDANYITPNKQFNKSIVSQLKNDLSKLGGNSAESDQANSQTEDNKKLEELKAKLPDWLKKLIECANAGKKPVKISDYAKVYNPIKEEVGKYYAEIAEAKKIPEDKQAKDVLLKVIQLMSLIKEGEKKPEGENTPAPQGEQPKEGQAEQPQQQQQQQANMKDNLNWLANEFYKYIRG